jgi:hypothetical protein
MVAVMKKYILTDEGEYGPTEDVINTVYASFISAVERNSSSK